MLLYYLKCKKYTESKNPKAIMTKNGRKMLLSKCPACDSKNVSIYWKDKKIVDY